MKQHSSLNVFLPRSCKRLGIISGVHKEVQKTRKYKCGISYPLYHIFLVKKRVIYYMLGYFMLISFEKVNSTPKSIDEG